MAKRMKDPEHGDFTVLPPEQQVFSFERLAVTLDQIESHGLQVLNEKLFRSEDDVKRFFIGGKKKDFALIHKQGDYYTYFEVEVDGIVSNRWEIVKQLVVGNVLKYWDPEIWESVKDEISIDRVREQIAGRVSLLKQEDRAP